MAIGRTNAGGGGAALNFKVVPGLTQPGTASENTIWVKAEQIGAWYFSATQPENMQEWDVWFETGTESDRAFNALRKNAVQVYPLSAKQMISGLIVDVESLSYQNGEWVCWWDGELYDAGNEFDTVTGGWTSDGFSYTGATVVSGFTKSSDRMSFYPSGSSDSTMTIGGCKNPIDLTPYKIIRVTYVNKALTSGQGLSLFIATGKDLKTTKTASTSFTSAVNTVKTEDISISAISGKHYIAALGFRSQYGEILSAKLVR